MDALPYGEGRSGHCWFHFWQCQERRPLLRRCWQAGKRMLELAQELAMVMMEGRADVGLQPSRTLQCERGPARRRGRPVLPGQVRRLLSDAELKGGLPPQSARGKLTSLPPVSTHAESKGGSPPKSAPGELMSLPPVSTHAESEAGSPPQSFGSNQEN